MSTTSHCEYGKHILCDDCSCPCHSQIEVPEECRCPGYPCEHVPPPPLTSNAPHVGYSQPVTMEMAERLRDAGLWAVADIAEKYAVDRPRWWHRFRAAS